MQRQFFLLCLSTLFIFTSSRCSAQGPDASYSSSTESAYQDVGADTSSSGDFVMSFPATTQRPQSMNGGQPTIIINNPAPQTQSNPNYYYSSPNEYPYDFDPYDYGTYGGYNYGGLDNRALDQGFDNGFRAGAGFRGGGGGGRR